MVIKNQDSSFSITIDDETKDYHFIPNKFFNCLCNSKYCIAKDGTVINIRSKKILKVNDNGNGYKQYVISCNNIVSKMYIHRILVDLFIENPLNYNEVDHIDRNKSNNSLDNLRWVTRKENLINRRFNLFSNIFIVYNQFLTNYKRQTFRSPVFNDILKYRKDKIEFKDEVIEDDPRYIKIILGRTSKNIKFDKIQEICKNYNIHPREVILEKNRIIIYNFIPTGNEEYYKYDNRYFVKNKGLSDELSKDIMKYYINPLVFSI